ncbi:putative nucleotide-binding alpha-beta plait domain superfamily, RNA-binding domain superfamily [Helianthus anomalus]
MQPIQIPLPMDHRRQKIPIPENVQRRITKIFVTNLPEGCSGSDLATQVRSYGHIFDLYIARKRDRGQSIRFYFYVGRERQG